MLITSEAQAAEALQAIYEAETVALDTESTGLHPYQDDVLRGISIAVGERTWYWSVSHPDSYNLSPTWLVQTLNAGQRRPEPQLQLWHHAQYDWSVLANAYPDFEVPVRHWDTQVVDWLLDENALSHELKVIGTRLFGTDASAEKKALAAIRKGRPQADIYKELREGDNPLFCARLDGKLNKGTVPAAKAEAKRLHLESRRDWPTFTAEDIAAYAEQDTRLTWDIAHWQMREVNDPYDAEVDVRPDIEREFTFQRVLYRMIRTGIKVNMDTALEYRRIAVERIAEIEAQFPRRDTGETILASTPLLGKMLYGRVEDGGWGLTTTHLTANGAYSANKEALQELEGEDPRVELILEWRQLTKAVGTYFNGLIDRTGRDGRIHSAFNSARTVTGRLSSSDPNLQNIPADHSEISQVRDLFVPREGYELWEFDLAQAELRVAAGWANETKMMDAIEAGRDLHSEVALSIWYPDLTLEEFEQRIEDGDKDAKGHRRLAKNVNYGYPYGIQAKKFATYVVKGTGKPVTIEDIAFSQQTLEGYERTYPNLARFMRGIARVAKRKGFIALHVDGRYRRYRSPGYRSSKFYTALNSIVQGGVAEFLKDVMIEAEPYIAEIGGFLCLQVHDSLVLELPPGMGEVVQAFLQALADRINPFKMRMIWDAKQWSSAHHEESV